MKTVHRPDWLLDATCEPPASHQALMGWYQPSWCPWIRLHLGRTGRRCVATWYCLEEQRTHARWRASLRDELMPLPDACGYSVVEDPFAARRTLRYAYDAVYQRFEIQIETGEPPQVTRIPLARVAEGVAKRTTRRKTAPGSRRLTLSGSGWLAIPALATVCTVVEALSPHGWDNLTMQLVPTAFAFLIL